MEWTTGSMMFYGGIACACAAILALVIVLFVFRGSKKRLRRKLDEEYGKSDK
ncbi:MAG: hypothetical protein FWH57_02340 [Oscillospiraceae bacterium]|nr:hypothetical protein [Oscillospiraceae bacterium]